VGQFTSRVLDVADLAEPSFRKRYTDLGFRPENQHRKAWEITYVSLLADHFGAGGGSGLGLGVAHEELLFHFANVCQRVVGIDLYHSQHWEGAALSPQQVYDQAPFPYRRECLEVRHMDMRNLEFPAASFDFVWSISVIEHVAAIEELETVFAGIQRVLKPGGHAFLTTEWNVVPATPRYVPGLIVFDEPLLRHLLAKTPGLELLGPVLTRQSASDLHTYHVHWTSNRNTEVRPLYNIFSSETFITPVALVLRRTSP
jgi:SAM-dependent methyltransferase